MMFGYACRETDELMPLPIMLAHGLTRRSGAVRARTASVPPARRQIAGHRRIRQRHAGPRRRDRGFDAACARRHERRTLESAVREAVIRPDDPGASSCDKDTQDLGQPDRAFRHRAARRATPASPAARSSSIPTAAWAATAAARSPARIPTKVDRSACYMARLHRQEPRRRRACGPRARCSCAYAIGVADPVSVLVEHLRHRNGPRGAIGRVGARGVPAHPGRDHRVPRPPQAGLSRDCGLRPLRQNRAWVHVGGHRSAPEAPGRRGELGRRPEMQATDAAEGTRRIAWAERSMPVLRILRERFLREKGAQRTTASRACLHVTPETANLLRTLQAGGCWDRAVRQQSALDAGRRRRLARGGLRDHDLRHARERTRRSVPSTSDRVLADPPDDDARRRRRPRLDRFTDLRRDLLPEVRGWDRRDDDRRDQAPLARGARPPQLSDHRGQRCA